MKKDEAKKLLQDWYNSGNEDPDEFRIMIDTIITAVVSDEREECAKIAQSTICDTHIPTGINIYGTRVAKAIRSKA